MTEPQDPPGLRMAALRDWLDSAAVGLDCSSGLSATLFASGRSNVTYLLTDAVGASVVLRRPPLGNVMPTAHDMAREYRVLTGLAQAGFPAPRPLAVCEDEDVLGAPFLVMEYVAGRIVGTADDVVALSPAERGAVSASLVGTLADLHAIDVASAGLSDLGRPDGYLARQVVRWAKQWDLTRTRELSAMAELRRRIDESVADLRTDLAWGLVHGDYRLDNVILERETARVRAVLDWEMSTLGDPLADLALTLVYWSEPGDTLRHRIPIAENLTDADGFWGREQIVTGYAERTGRPIDHLDVCTALACYKLAVIAESIHARTLSGKQLGQAAGDRSGMGQATEALADMGLAVTERGTVAGLSS